MSAFGEAMRDDDLCNHSDLCGLLTVTLRVLRGVAYKGLVNGHLKFRVVWRFQSYRRIRTNRGAKATCMWRKFRTSLWN